MSLLFMQLGQRTCILFNRPHEGQWQRAVTSSSPFPAICLDLLFEYEGFFFGTARSMPSQNSCSRPGRFKLIGGNAAAKAGSFGCHHGFANSATGLYRRRDAINGNEPTKGLGIIIRSGTATAMAVIVEIV